MGFDILRKIFIRWECIAIERFLFKSRISHPTDLSDSDTKEIRNFRRKHKKEDIKNNKELLKKYKDLYNKYEDAYWEVDADNVALALQYYIGNANNQNIGIICQKIIKLRGIKPSFLF